ncbi:hypothetical protein D3C84_850380 [compost metagenome]
MPVERRQVKAIGEFRNPRVGHQVTHRAQGFCLLCEPRQISGLCHIPGYPRQLCREAFRQLRQATDLARHGQHSGALAQQPLGDSQADSGTGAGDDGQTVLKSIVHKRVPFFGQ